MTGLGGSGQAGVRPRSAEVQAGAVADLLILDGSPPDDLSCLRSPTVIRNGRLLSRVRPLVVTPEGLGVS